MVVTLPPPSTVSKQMVWHLYRQWPNNVDNLGKLTIDKGFKKWSKVQ